MLIGINTFSIYIGNTDGVYTVYRGGIPCTCKGGISKYGGGGGGDEMAGKKVSVDNAYTSRTTPIPDV